MLLNEMWHEKRIESGVSDEAFFSAIKNVHCAVLLNETWHEKRIKSGVSDEAFFSAIKNIH